MADTLQNVCSTGNTYDGTIEAANLQTHGDIYAGSGIGDGAHIELHRGDTPYASIITSAASLAGDIENITPSVSGNLVNDKIFQSADDPTTTDIPDGTWKIWYNTTTLYINIWANIGGYLAIFPGNFPDENGNYKSVIGGRPNDR